jgi:hypothetical protein
VCRMAHAGQGLKIGTTMIPSTASLATRGVTATDGVKIALLVQITRQPMGLGPHMQTSAFSVNVAQDRKMGLRVASLAWMGLTIMDQVNCALVAQTT